MNVIKREGLGKRDLKKGADSVRAIQNCVRHMLSDATIQNLMDFLRCKKVPHLASTTARLTKRAVRTTDTSVSSLLTDLVSIGALSGSAAPAKVLSTSHVNHADDATARGHLKNLMQP